LRGRHQSGKYINTAPESAPEVLLKPTPLGPASLCEHETTVTALSLLNSVFGLLPFCGIVMPDIAASYQ
jgi:hypothetical protein